MNQIVDFKRYRNTQKTIDKRSKPTRRSGWCRRSDEERRGAYIDWRSDIGFGELCNTNPREAFEKRKFNYEQPHMNRRSNKERRIQDGRRQEQRRIRPAGSWHTKETSNSLYAMPSLRSAYNN